MPIHEHQKKKSIHFIFLFIILQILPLSLGDAKSVSDQLSAPSGQIARRNATMEQKTNFTSPAASGPARVSPSAVKYAPVHIPRKKRQTQTQNVDKLEFMDLHTTHLPCDFDTSQAQEFLPENCEYTFARRYVSEAAYRNYQMYRMEGFTFGMYYERLKRYESEVPSFDYANVLA